MSAPETPRVSPERLEGALAFPDLLGPIEAALAFDLFDARATIASLQAENEKLREQVVGIVARVMAGCTGVTLGHTKDPKWKCVLRCDLEKVLQVALAEAAGHTSTSHPEGT